VQKLMQSRAMTKPFATLLSALALVGAFASTGCAEGDTCKELGSCGGNLVGAWTYASPPCQSLLDEPPTEVWLFNRPATVARTPPPESFASEWCAGFVLSSSAPEMAVAKPPIFWVGGEPYVNGRVWYKEDGTYESRFSRNGTYGLDFSTACMRNYGSQLACGDIQQLIKDKAANPNITDITCRDGAELGSCSCTFSLAASGRVIGAYAVSGSTVTHRPLRPKVLYPSDAVYCAQGDRLQLSGARTTSLFDSPGLRTLDMKRINCADGAQGDGEDGVDCGLMCPNLCEGQVEPEPLP